MYIEPARGYYAGTEQRTSRGRFLLLLQPRLDLTQPYDCKLGDPSPLQRECSAENTYAVVRKVALRQLGHFMMGRVNLCGKWHSVSGAYGSDGLPMSVDKLPSDAVKLPRELFDKWSRGGGWNGPGNEATDMRTWALATFPQ
jgi:hypothetical protein